MFKLFSRQPSFKELALQRHLELQKEVNKKTHHINILYRALEECGKQAYMIDGKSQSRDPLYWIALVQEKFGYKAPKDLIYANNNQQHMTKELIDQTKIYVRESINRGRDMGYWNNPAFNELAQITEHLLNLLDKEQASTNNN